MTNLNLGFLAPIAASLLGNILIFIGLAFVNGRFLSSTLSSIYDVTGTGTRNLLMALLFAMPANAIFAWCYKETSPTLAGMCQIVTLVIVILVNASLLGQILPPKTWAAAAALLAAAAWFGWEASKA